MSDIKTGPVAFATLADLEARWHEVSEADQSKAQAALYDATALIQDECERAGVDTADIRPITLTTVCCAMVIRKMTTDDDHLGVSNSQQTAGSFSESFTYSNPMGDLYLTTAERKRLGLRKQRAFAYDSDAASTPTVWWRPL